MRPSEVLDSFDLADTKQFGPDANHGSFKAGSSLSHREKFAIGSPKMNVSEDRNVAGRGKIGLRRSLFSSDQWLPLRGQMEFPEIRKFLK
jgi:hypothetical protein